MHCNRRPVLGAALAAFFVLAGFGRAAAPETAWNAPHAGNPVLPGYYADPSVVQFAGKFYVYATLDPWGGRTLGCWESPDFKHWTYQVLNWPTKEACSSPESNAGAAVWAPSVVRAPNGRFFMFVSVGSEVWVGSAAHPLGPWTDAHGGKPLIGRDYDRAYHMIDAEAFIDDDGTAYLYWGSGWNWVNGRCYAVKLKSDFVTFDGEVQVVTPAGGHYFEGPFMAKRGGRYFLMYSDGVTMRDTYCVHYAVGATPFGPFTEAANSPILATDRARDIVSPGHHAVFRYAGRDFIAYHRHRLPFVTETAYRQLCVDEIEFTADGRIEKVTPTHAGPALVQGRAEPHNLATAAIATASSQLDEFHGAAAVLDDNYATGWEPAANTPGGWLQLDLGAVMLVHRSELRFEYAWKSYAVALEASVDGKIWQTLVDHRTDGGVTGSPIGFAKPARARYLRLQFAETLKNEPVAVIEWAVF